MSHPASLETDVTIGMIAARRVLEAGLRPLILEADGRVRHNGPQALVSDSTWCTTVARRPLRISRRSRLGIVDQWYVVPDGSVGRPRVVDTGSGGSCGLSASLPRAASCASVEDGLGRTCHSAVNESSPRSTRLAEVPHQGHKGHRRHNTAAPNAPDTGQVFSRTVEVSRRASPALAPSQRELFGGW